MAEKKQALTVEQTHRERGQSIALIAFMMIGLIALVGIAVDVGVIFARQAELSKAVDAAVLSSVTEVLNINQLGPADTKAGQFLSANLPVTVTQLAPSPPAGAGVLYNSAAGIDILGAVNYSLTATWPVELFFLRVIGRDIVTIEQSATAAYFPVTDIYASRRVEDGALSTSNQAVFGPNICSGYGDPFSPFDPNWANNNDLYDGLYSYRYRILIPPDYSDDVIRVELFDPDSINRDNNDGNNRYTTSVLHTQAAGGGFETLSCNGNRKNPCLIDTGEAGMGLPLDQVNPWWFIRIDENRGAGSAPGSGGCGQPANYSEAYNTSTSYELYYFAARSDGTIDQIPLSRYVGQTNDGVRDVGDHDTDMRWVSPGGAQSFDQPVFVPADFGSFEVNIANDLTNIISDPATGVRYLYLDVRSLQGASENGFEIWAGPDDYINTVPSDVNLRNVKVLDEPGSHSSLGATVFGMGNLPLNSNFGNRVDIPLIYVPAEYAGQTVQVSLFDTDSGALPPVYFYFDTVSRDDWEVTFGDGNDPDGLGAGRCLPGGCNNQWVDPPYQITIPTLDPAACQADPSDQDVCTPFFGGRLVADYEGGGNDSYGWEIRLAGNPFLVR